MIKKIIVSGDLLRVKKVNNLPVNFHEKRINKYFDFLKYQLEEASNLPVYKWNTDNTDFSPEYIYKKCGLEYGEPENWLKIYDLKEIPDEVISYYFQYMQDALIIYIEMSLLSKTLHKILNLPYIDLTVHPVRFLDDHMFGMATNCEYIFHRIKKYQIEESQFYLHANMIKSIVDFNPLPIARNSALIAGQTNVDKALYSNGKCLSIMDFEGKIAELGKIYDVLYYKAHPFNSDLKTIYKFLSRFEFVKLCPSDWNIYKILSNDNLKKVYAITSGVLYEAPYFGRESETLYKLYLNLDYRKDCPFKEETYLSVYNDFINPMFWNDILQDVVDVNQYCKNIQLPVRANRLRATFNDYWSYTELDPTVITIQKQYHTKIGHLNNKTSESENQINRLNESIAVLNNQISILRSDPCFEKNIIKRQGKRIIFSLSSNSVYFNPVIVLKKLKMEAAPYQEENGPITSIKAITYRPHSPNGGRGGGGAVLSAMQKILGNDVAGYPITYNYSERDGIWHTLKNRYYTYANYQRFINEESHLTPLYAAITFTIAKTKDEQGKLYICHEYATAYALSLLKKRYILVIHTQGTRVDEKLALGEALYRSEINVIKACEKCAIRNAIYTCFPSHGAEDMYFSSKYCTVQKEKIHVGPVLYNTVYASPIIKELPQITGDSSCITFLSVGTLTTAKGQDKVCEFFHSLLKNHNQKIRWICVGKGPLQEQVVERAGRLAQEWGNFEFIYLPKIEFAEVQYLYTITDVYIMLHRISVFDLASLEAMKNACAVLLSPVGGNLELNVNENIIYTDSDASNIEQMLDEKNISCLKAKNEEAYRNFFSEEQFKDRYEKLLQNTIKLYNQL